MIKDGTNPYFVKELETGYVVIGDNQHFYGYTLFLYKHHGEKTELFHLEPTERAKFLEEMTVVAEAVSRAFGAEKINMGTGGLCLVIMQNKAGFLCLLKMHQRLRGIYRAVSSCGEEYHHTRCCGTHQPYQRIWGILAVFILLGTNTRSVQRT